MLLTMGLQYARAGQHFAPSKGSVCLRQQQSPSPDQSTRPHPTPAHAHLCVGQQPGSRQEARSPQSQQPPASLTYI